MFALVIGLLSSLFSSSGVIGTYLSNKQAQIKCTQDYQLAVLQAQLTQATQENICQTDVQKAKLDATTAAFKEHSFYFLVLPIIITIIFPKFATEMWANFNVIPAWFQSLFATIYLTIWGVPVAGGYISTIFSNLSSSRADAVATMRGINTSTNNITMQQPLSALPSPIGNLDKAKFYENIRKGLGGSLDQKTADLLEDSLNKAAK